MNLICSSHKPVTIQTSRGWNLFQLSCLLFTRNVRMFRMFFYFLLERFKHCLCLYLPFYGFSIDVFFVNNYFWLYMFFLWCITMWCRGSAPCLYNKDVNMHVTKFYWKTESVLSHRPLYNVCSCTTSVLLIITFLCFILEEQKHRNCS